MMKELMKPPTPDYFNSRPCPRLLCVQEAKNAILFRGTGLAASPSSSSVIPVLRGHCTTYSALLEKPITRKPPALASHAPPRCSTDASGALAAASMTPGKKTMLVAALQARNNARCTVSGSLALFSDSFYNSEVTTQAPYSRHFPA